MNVRILDEAENDLMEGFSFYETQSSGLGDHFLDSLFADIDLLLHRAGIHPVFMGYHRLLARRFPFAVFYKVEQGTTNVWAVLDTRQDPAAIDARLHDMRAG